MHRIGAALVLVTACSLTVRPPPSERTGPELVDCTTNYLAPTLDAVAFVATTIARCLAA